MCAEKVAAIAASLNVGIKALESEYYVTCVIGVENDTEWNMANPQWTTHHGSVRTPPAVIKAGGTGIIACHKTAFTVTGCGITASWDLGDTKTRISINFGIAGGGWSWINPNHLELKIADQYGGNIDKDRAQFDAGGRTVSVSSNLVDIEGTMGDSDHARIMVTVHQKK